MRILFLSTSMGLGGADQQLLSAAQVLRDRGHEIRIVSLTPLGPMGLQARSLGLATDSLEMRRGVPDPRGLARLVRIVRAWKPDVVHSHMVHANLMARVVRLLVPVPVLVSTIHNVYEGGPLLMAGYRLTNGLVDHMTIISQAAADRFVGERIVPGRLLTVIANGVDTDRMRNLPPEGRAALRGEMSVGDQQFVWLAVGRFEAAKDYPNMLRAFGDVRAREPRAVLVIVGQGSLQADAEALTAELGLREAVRFLGARDDVPAVMSAADGYVMSSAWEGMPMVLLEAAAAGLPIVATAVGGNGEVVRDGESGFLVPARDSGLLRAGMLRLMALPEEQRRAMGERGREHVRANYGLQRVAERWERVYWDALARKGFTLEPSASP
ncbi:MAG TPA: glycosyltransferase [Gemmatimonadales bacterium]|nr:glycosyltransferase [Gemmatimonadales bacterium]